MSNTSVSLKLCGKDFICTVCENTEFIQKRVVLTTIVENFLGMGRSKENAEVLVCNTCGYLHWFLPTETKNVDKEKLLKGIQDE